MERKRWRIVPKMLISDICTCVVSECLLIFAVNGVLRQCASNIVQGDHLSRMSRHDQTKWDREWVRQDCSQQRLSQLRFALENSLNKSLCICTTSLCDSMTSLVNLKPSRWFTQRETCEVEARCGRSVTALDALTWVSCGIQSFYFRGKKIGLVLYTKFHNVNNKRYSVDQNWTSCWFENTQTECRKCRSCSD